MKRILFVDDEPDVLDGLKRTFRKQNLPWICKFVSSGEEALEVMSEHAIDALVTDYRMPGMDGKELLEVVSKEYSETVQIILSGIENITDEIWLATGLQFLEKPCSTKKLITTIERGLFLKNLFQLNFIRLLSDSFRDFSTFPELQIRIQSEKNTDEGISKAAAEIICPELGIRFRIPLNTAVLTPELV